uniref:Putative secreted protein n=1 Tax=Ixodes ricinus TaxID=34613 RepID=A0A6B0UDJ6_IXORI
MWNIICVILISTSADTETETSVVSGNIGLVLSELWPRHVEPRGLVTFVGARYRTRDAGRSLRMAWTVMARGRGGRGEHERGEGGAEKPDMR